MICHPERLPLHSQLIHGNARLHTGEVYFEQRNILTKQVGLIEIVGELARMDLPSQFVFHIKLHSTSQCAP